jgi:1-pyrroline-5-carboxylate dehydrogenase
MFFKNEMPSDFSLGADRTAMQEALRRVQSELGKTYTAIVDGKSVKARSTFKSVNPSRPKEVIGVLQNAERKLADAALETATKAFPSWSRAPVSRRAEILRQMAKILRRKKMEFCAWLVYEVGKNWVEADADVAEAIDFLEYYAELALLPPPVLTPVSGEKNEYRYLPLGPVVVIPPWNFPLAILVGMTTAALVTGNTVVLKPSSQAPVIAAKFVQLAQEAGLPDGVLSFLTGAGGSIGDYLVGDPRTRMIAFTGSKAVGLHINALAAKTAPGQKWVKRVIAEMGGKNAIIVDESADLDSAAQGALASAFGYQGQKCSACSRLYVHAAVYDDFLARFLERAKKIRQGPADVYENYMGPVISEGAKKTIEKYIALGKREGRMLVASPGLSAPSPIEGGASAARGEAGYFVPATIFDRLPENSKLFHEEIFGPVLAVAKVKSFDEAMRLTNSTDYGLTGAVYSKDPAHLELARDEFFCGNLYLNRKCTGALVGGHPFGGFNMSGTDSKAGGPDYLLLFTQAKCVSEKPCS